jgi:peptide/nickel transport system substrate-binding protein
VQPPIGLQARAVLNFRSVLARGCLAALAFATWVVLPGCSPRAPDAVAGNWWTRHGLLRIANLAEPDSLNPVVGNEQIDAELAMLWGGFLFNYNDRNEFVPELATELPSLQNGGVSKDGLAVTYHLRRGVTWQDGAPFDARDVVFTYRAIVDGRNNVPSTVGYELIRRLEVIDLHTIRVHLKHPWAPFVATFFNQSSQPYPLLPAHLLSKYPAINQVPFNAQPVGTGPFSVRRWQRGSKIVFEANPHY